MDVEKSHLYSIVEEELEQDAEPKTQVALLKLYHQLYAIDYIKLPSHQHKQHFSALAGQFNDSHPLPVC